tara:strand:- start:335 stop:490 length:156 start_codon:yes stop_codon:yes gene_type:complete
VEQFQLFQQLHLLVVETEAQVAAQLEPVVQEVELQEMLILLEQLVQVIRRQ